jgi:hypothetical protein
LITTREKTQDSIDTLVERMFVVKSLKVSEVEKEFGFSLLIHMREVIFFSLY